VPIIALTARTVSDDRERAKAIGCDAYLNKPVDFDELIEAVAQYINTGHEEDGNFTPREYYLQEQNVTLIEKLEQKITELEAAYEHLKHLEQAKTAFISVVSHELRTPLTLVSSYTQMLQSLPTFQQDEAAKQFMEGVLQGAGRLQEIINDMVSVIRVELVSRDQKFAPVSIRSVIKSVEEEQAAAVKERNLTLEVQVPNDLSMINGDSKQLHSAITRIVGNAIKYTPDGGQVSITAQGITRPNGESVVQIVVTDTGVGVDRDKQKLIFEKFSTAENLALHSTSKTQFMGGGIGLGLTIAKGVIESHNGEIWVESDGYDPDNLPGSKFFVVLPTL
jgi:hypothetical protein